MMEELDNTERRKCISNWHVAFKKGTDFDLWGQPVEAIACYERLAACLRHEGHYDAEVFSDDQKKILNKIAACLEMRSKDLQAPGKLENITLENLRKIENFLTNLLSTTGKEFPVEVSGVSAVPKATTEVYAVNIDRSDERDAHQTSKPSEEEQTESVEEIVDQRTRGYLLPPPDALPGKTFVTVRIDKIGLKDATQYIDSFIAVSVRDGSGRLQGAEQKTPIAVHKDDSYIYLGADVYLQEPVEKLPPGFAVFFEFKHYKPRKKSLSTKCWAFIEKDEIKEGPLALELYSKPTDYKRKKISLLTVKPLFLHIKLTING